MVDKQDLQADMTPEDAGDEPAVYELGYHIISSVSEEALPKEVASVTSALKELGGSFIGEGFPTRMKLAYSISKKIDGSRRDFDSAYFGWLTFELEPAKIGAFKSALETLPSMLRFLIIRTTREELAAAAAPQIERAAPMAGEIKRLVEDESNAGTLSEKDLDVALEGIASSEEKTD
jgi:ribosomal protein S6